MCVFDLFSLKIVSPLWRNDLVYILPQVKLIRHWQCGEWLALPQGYNKWMRRKVRVANKIVVGLFI